MKTSGPPWTSRLRHYLQRGPGKLAFLQAAADRHRPLVELSLVPPRQRSFLLTEPDDIGHVLQTHHARYRKSNVLTGPRGRQRSGTGLLTGVGQPAITQKRLLQPVLAQAVGPVFDDIIRATTAEWLDAQPPGAWLDVLPAMTALTRRILGRILFSGDFDHEYRPLALAWTLYLTARHPAAQRRLADPAGAELVFAEALRLCPPTWIFVRVPETDDSLPSGAPVPAGATLYLSPYVTQRDPRFFPRPDEFDPDRFTDEAKSSRPRFAYFPFSAGPRVCLGQTFAQREAVGVLTALARRFAWEPGPPVEPYPGRFLFPTQPIRIRWRAL